MDKITIFIEEDSQEEKNKVLEILGKELTCLQWNKKENIAKCPWCNYTVGKRVKYARHVFVAHVVLSTTQGQNLEQAMEFIKSRTQIKAIADKTPPVKKEHTPSRKTVEGERNVFLNKLKGHRSSLVREKNGRCDCCKILTSSLWWYSSLDVAICSICKSKVVSGNLPDRAIIKINKK